MIKGIFFDFDGTVSDARAIAEESLLKTLDEFGFKYSKKKALSLLGNKMHIILEKLELNIGRDLQKIRKRFYKHFVQAAKDGRIKPCVSFKSLYDLKEDYPLVIISNSETVFLNASIKTLKIKGLFTKVYGAEKFTRKDVLLKKLFKKMKIDPSEAIYVGDRFSDIDFARAAGCIAVGINNKCAWSTLAVIKKEKPDYIIKDFRELKILVKKLNLKK